VRVRYARSCSDALRLTTTVHGAVDCRGFVHSRLLYAFGARNSSGFRPVRFQRSRRTVADNFFRKLAEQLQKVGCRPGGGIYARSMARRGQLRYAVLWPGGTLSHRSRPPSRLTFHGFDLATSISSSCESGILAPLNRSFSRTRVRSKLGAYRDVS
jgi:hypothetical protein